MKKSLLTCIIGIISSVLWLYYGVVKDKYFYDGDQQYFYRHHRFY